MITIENAQEFALLRMDGHLDLGDAASLEAALANLDSEPAIIVSLEAAASIDSTLLSVFARANARAATSVVLIVAPGSQTERLLSIYGIDGSCCCVPSLDRAVAVCRTLRDVSAASFSRDGVANPPKTMGM